jgi:hypothetical protein
MHFDYVWDAVSPIVGFSQRIGRERREAEGRPAIMHMRTSADEHEPRDPGTIGATSR